MIRKAKTCWGCRCLQERAFVWDFYCDKWYTLKMIGADPVPQEPCPKPRTWAEWSVAKEKDDGK
jgi:hypothetical protein